MSKKISQTSTVLLSKNVQKKSYCSKLTSILGT